MRIRIISTRTTLGSNGRTSEHRSFVIALVCSRNLLNLYIDENGIVVGKRVFRLFETGLCDDN